MSTQNLYERLYARDMIDRAYKKAMSGKRKFRKESVLFDACREVNLQELREELKRREYQPGEYGTMIAHEKKDRLVHYPHLRDKLVQFGMHEITQELFKPIFIKHTYANRKGVGTHDAVWDIQHNMRFVKWKYGDAWIIKIDIRKFYYTLDRKLVKQLIRKRVPKEETDFLTLVDAMIDSSPEENGVGLPLGNVTSQDDAGIVGNEIDQYCTRQLHLRHYTRYADDIIIVVPTRQEAKDNLKLIEAFISERLHMETNEKTRIFPVNQGVKALGFRIYTTHILLQDWTIQHMKARMKAIDAKVKAGEITEKRAQQEVDSWLGHARVANAYKLCEKIFKPYPYIRYDRQDWHFGERSPRRKKSTKKRKT